MGQESNISSLTCICNHLTAFGGDVIIAPNIIDFVLVQQAFDNLDPGDLLVLITVCSAFLVYFVVLVIARRAENRDVLKVCINNLCNEIYSIFILRWLWNLLPIWRTSMLAWHRTTFIAGFSEPCVTWQKTLLSKISIFVFFHFREGVHKIGLNEKSSTITTHTYYSFIHDPSWLWEYQ